jgi:hypothetical protein
VAGDRAVGPADLHPLAPVLVRFAERDPEREILSGAVAGDDELIQRAGSEGARGRASGVGVDGQDERAGTGRGRKDVQVTGVYAAVGERGRAVEVVRHR